MSDTEIDVIATVLRAANLPSVAELVTAQSAELTRLQDSLRVAEGERDEARNSLRSLAQLGHDEAVHLRQLVETAERERDEALDSLRRARESATFGIAGVRDALDLVNAALRTGKNKTEALWRCDVILTALSATPDKMAGQVAIPFIKE